MEKWMTELREGLISEARRMCEGCEDSYNVEDVIKVAKKLEAYILDKEAEEGK